jgi:AraC-like DNA-binding protein/quercetin dioxygenase-like cupin family protein
MRRERLESGQMAPKSGQNDAGELYAKLVEFDADLFDAPVVGQLIEVTGGKQSVPMHQHKRGQLLTTLKGTVRCETVDGSWTVASNSALWIPGRRAHRSIVSSRGTLLYLYLAEGIVSLPTTSCFLSLTPLAREMVKHIVDAGPRYPADSVDGKVALAFVALIQKMDLTEPYISLPSSPRLKSIAEALLKAPGDRRTASQWAAAVGMSEKSLRRLLLNETGLSFLQWRQQFQLIVAVRALREGNSVQEVAGLVGYDSTAAFNTMFKKAMGVSPGRFSTATSDSSWRQNKPSGG